MALNNPAEVTSTPADRSNSPPIISMPTPTATMPIVEAWYSTVKNDSDQLPRREGGRRGVGLLRLRLAGVVLREGNDLVDIRRVDEGRAGERRLAATDVIAVLEVEIY